MPCFLSINRGGGHDLYMPNSCNQAYFSAHTYSNYYIGFPQTYGYVQWFCKSNFGSHLLDFTFS